MEQTAFTDSDGVVWNVREDGSEDPRALTADVPPGTTWLRFESELEVRRLWHYPDDWRGLSPIQLESLLDRASTVIARFRPAVHPVGGGTATRDKQSVSPEARPPSQRADNSSVDRTRRDKK